MYDDNGTYIGFTYNGTEYYYIYNLQGDVVALANSTGTIIARYTYGPWGTVDAVTDNAGNDISSNASHIANINPIRYRGYYYDTETGFYYVSSHIITILRSVGLSIRIPFWVNPVIIPIYLDQSKSQRLKDAGF